MATATRRETPKVISSGLTASVVQTALGAIGVVESERGLLAVRVGFASTADLDDWIAREFGIAERVESPIADRLAAYALGERDHFRDVHLDQTHPLNGHWTPFRARVTEQCRQIEIGKTASYADLAERAGNARASRAVGTVMARNPWPIVVPCHRIVRRDGQIGGFSAPSGVPLKQRLLELEQSMARHS